MDLIEDFTVRFFVVVVVLFIASNVWRTIVVAIFFFLCVVKKRVIFGACCCLFPPNKRNCEFEIVTFSWSEIFGRRKKAPKDFYDSETHWNSDKFSRVLPLQVCVSRQSLIHVSIWVCIWHIFAAGRKRVDTCDKLVISNKLRHTHSHSQTHAGTRSVGSNHFVFTSKFIFTVVVAAVVDFG